jgi:formylglycine-generating enzyme required for sulfatase activity
MKTKQLSRILFLVFLLAFVGAKGKGKKLILQVERGKTPVATRQLGPAIFFDESVISDLHVAEGTPVKVSCNGRTEFLRIYKFFGGKDKFALRNEYAEKLGIQEGTYQITVEPSTPEEAGISSKPIRFVVENYKGDLKKWKGYAFGAPHGDCDNETGAVVKIVSRLYGIPATAAYGCRVSYRGIWYDCNRPLMKLPKPGNRGVFPERQWNRAAVEKYKIYQDSVWANSNLSFGKRFKLFCSFHGHDLTVKLPGGKKIQRPVIEGIGVGFSKNELRRIKKYYYSVSSKYYTDPPDLYFGNLPEDLTYYYKGVRLTFFYSGLGTRTYGSLRSDLVQNALHLETPDMMRIGKQAQSATADLLFNLYTFIKDSIFTSRKVNVTNLTIKKPVDLGKMVTVPAGEFLMGAPNGFGWSAERPQHKVWTDEFQIDKYEVTNEQYSNFLTAAFKVNKIIVKNGVVRSADNTDRKYCLTKQAVPFAQIKFDGVKFTAEKGKEFFPVVYVTYYGALAYARFYGMDLPTEAEWEKAASWDGKRKYLFGVQADTIDGTQANFEDSGDPFDFNSLPGTTPVGFYDSQSPYGLKDVSGNVWEWCSDNYIYGYYRTIKEKLIFNPTGPDTSTIRTIRGGAWNTEPFVTRTTMRLGINPNTPLVNLGFRCVKRKYLKKAN